MIEMWLFLVLLALSGVWAISVFDRQSRRASQTLRTVDTALRMAEEEGQRLDYLECAVEDYVQQRRDAAKGASCPIRPHSSSRW